jgi:hypothetical protein
MSSRAMHVAMRREVMIPKRKNEKSRYFTNSKMVMRSLGMNTIDMHRAPKAPNKPFSKMVSEDSKE